MLLSHSVTFRNTFWNICGVLRSSVFCIYSGDCGNLNCGISVAKGWNNFIGKWTRLKPDWTIILSIGAFINCQFNFRVWYYSLILSGSRSRNNWIVLSKKQTSYHKTWIMKQHSYLYILSFTQCQTNHRMQIHVTSHLHPILQTWEREYFADGYIKNKTTVDLGSCSNIIEYLE